MPRNREDARGRLQRAALELFAERGYDQTTATEIAARAGVTERTFFRHFADKREVLFDGEAKLRVALTAAIAAAPAGLGPLDTLFWAFHAIERMLEENRPFAEPRQRVIASTPALHERELAKLASLAGSLAAALRERGVDDRLATLGAQAGMMALGHAVISWFGDPAPGLGGHLDRTRGDLQRLLGPAPGGGSP